VSDHADDQSTARAPCFQADGFSDNKSNGFYFGLTDAVRRLPATMMAAKQRVTDSGARDGVMEGHISHSRSPMSRPNGKL
jgi:hypothetical protein